VAIILARRFGIVIECNQ